MSRIRSAGAGVAAALLWAAVEPLDTRALRHDYSDVAVLGKAVTHSPLWPVAGLALHAANGAIFGLCFDEVRRRTRLRARPLALSLALVEHLTLFPLGIVVDQRHPARGERGLAPLWSSRAFVLATWRHALFGVALARLADDEATA